MSIRNDILMEALRAVENERLDDHELYLLGKINELNDGDEAYSRAIRDAEEAIKDLMNYEAH